MEWKTSEELFTNFITKAAIQTVCEQYPDKTFDKETLQNMREEAESTVKEITLTLYKIRKEERKGEDAVSHLSAERITKIKESLDLKTFEIKINKHEKKAEIKRNGEMMYPSIALDSVANLNQASKLQIASIVIESIILVLDLVGVFLPDNREIVQRAVDLVVVALGKTNNILVAVEKIRRDRDDMLATAGHILMLVLDTFYDGIFWTIVKALLVNMSPGALLVTSTKLAAFIAALVFTGGLVYYAKLVMMLAHAVKFIQKLANLETLDKMRLAITAS